jgi:hypothetical protein
MIAKEQMPMPVVFPIGPIGADVVVSKERDGPREDLIPIPLFL